MAANQCLGAPEQLGVRAFFAGPAKRVIHAMGEDHAKTPCEGDGNFAAVRRE